ncbi:MAG: hypothetical protein QUS11_09570 [Candidatus Fermentibacter sp.]|nr:hypothetical protein [Candidatus Fermentibacter sp.]
MSGQAEFDLRVITHDRIVYEGRAVSIVAPGVSGYLGILARHAPIVASLGNGTLTVFRTDGTEIAWSMNLGLLEAGDNRVSILVEDIRQKTG